jgi:hypothetical protein
MKERCFVCFVFAFVDMPFRVLREHCFPDLNREISQLLLRVSVFLSGGQAGRTKRRCWQNSVPRSISKNFW